MAVSPDDLARTLLRRAKDRADEDRRERDRCLTAAEGVLRELRRVLGVGRVWVIGSLAWGGFGLRSDIDVVVEDASAEAAEEIAEQVGAATGRRVDVLLLDRLPASFARRVLTEGRVVT